MVFELLLVLMYLMMSGGAGSSRRNDRSSSSWLKGRKQQQESILATNYLREKKDLSFDIFIVWNAIHEQYMKLEDFVVVDGFLECLEPQE